MSGTDWEPTPPLWEARTGASLIAISTSELLVAGGEGRTTDFLSSCEIFDHKTGAWYKEVPSMPQAKSRCASALLNKRVYLIGGEDSNGPSETAHTYNVEKRTWKAIRALPGPRSSCAAVAVEETGHVYVFGGHDDTHRMKSALRYCKATCEWERLPAMKVARDACAAVFLSGKIYVLGGQGADAGALASVEVFDISSQTWDYVSFPKMPEAREGLAAVAVGRYLVVTGGYDDAHDMLGSTIILDTTKDKLLWECLPTEMIRWRACHDAAVLEDCRVVAVGGVADLEGKLAAAETLYLPQLLLDKSAFLELLLTDDGRNVHLKINDLIPLIENVHDCKLFYTFTSCLARVDKLELRDHKQYILDALTHTKSTTSTSDAVAHFKLILEKAVKDGLLVEHTRLVLDRDAEIVSTSHAPFVQDIREHLQRLDVRIGEQERRVDAVEESLQQLSKTVRQVQENLRRKQQVEAVSGFMGAVLNAVSFGVAGSVLQGAVGTALSHIVDFGDFAHVSTVLSSAGEVTVQHSLQTALDMGEEYALARPDAKIEEAFERLAMNLETQMKKSVSRHVALGHQEDAALTAVVFTAHIITSTLSPNPDRDSLSELSSPDLNEAPPPPIRPTHRRQPSSAKERLSNIALEVGLAEESESDLPTSERLRLCEEQWFGEAKSGPLGPRLSDLEDQIGIS